MASVPGGFSSEEKMIHNRGQLREDDAALAMAMRQTERSGRPLGDETFVRQIWMLLRRNLTRQNPVAKPGKDN
jgi:hypothetical protein